MVVDAVDAVDAAEASAENEIESSLNLDDLELLDVTNDMLDLDDASQGVAVDPLQDDWHYYHLGAVRAFVKAEDKIDLTHYYDCSPCQVGHD